jgi:UDP-N-acetylglucosamine--N-acetylmuramyl-(pentapeptide) pyrophosphoryl-undecaprenol N-acetylglucosamine transferase
MSTAGLVWVMAGGTGGHIMPGLAVAQRLREAGYAVRWVGNPEKMEGRLVAAQGFEMIKVQFAGVRGKGVWGIARAPFYLLGSLAALWRAASKARPDLVLGMGGYVALPGGLMAFLRGIPMVLHEQNAIAGKTNLWLARLTTHRLEGFPTALPQGQWVGNPVRENLLTLPSPQHRYESRHGPLRVLIVGGSLGAAALNEILPLAIAQLPISERPDILHQAGRGNINALREAYEKHAVQAQCVEFIDDMAQAMVEADLMICRAGAMTVSEVAAVGVAALFVPYPHAVDDHQTANANYLVDHDAAFLQQQRGLTAPWLAQWLRTQTRETLTVVAQAAHAMAKPQATEVIAQRCLALIKEAS